MCYVNASLQFLFLIPSFSSYLEILFPLKMSLVTYMNQFVMFFILFIIKTIQKSVDAISILNAINRWNISTFPMDEFHEVHEFITALFNVLGLDIKSPFFHNLFETIIKSKKRCLFYMKSGWKCIEKYLTLIVNPSINKTI